MTACWWALVAHEQRVRVLRMSPVHACMHACMHACVQKADAHGLVVVSEDGEGSTLLVLRVSKDDIYNRSGGAGCPCMACCVACMWGGMHTRFGLPWTALHRAGVTALHICMGLVAKPVAPCTAMLARRGHYHQLA